VIRYEDIDGGFDRETRRTVARLCERLPDAMILTRKMRLDDWPGVLHAVAFIIDPQDGRTPWARPAVLWLRDHGEPYDTDIVQGSETLDMTCRIVRHWGGKPKRLGERWEIVLAGVEAAVLERAQGGE